MDLTIHFDVTTEDFQNTMLLTCENLNYYMLKKAFEKVGVWDDDDLDKPWLGWSHYLWAEDWNSQRPLPRLSMSVWNQETKQWENR